MAIHTGKTAYVQNKIKNYRSKQGSIYIPITPTFREAELGRSEIQRHLQLHSEFVVNLAYMNVSKQQQNCKNTVAIAGHSRKCQYL